jgi:hypothetical protein
MSRGRFDILVKGLEDVYISDNPTYTFFSSVYKTPSYTTFTTSEVSTPLHRAGFGRRFRISLESLKGDIINNIFIRFVFPYKEGSFVFSKYVIYTMFNYIDLYIGGQLIERLTGDFMYHYMRLKSSEDDWTNILINTRTTEFINPSIPFTNACIIPIPFYFYKKNYLGIPIGALSHQHVELEMYLKPIYTLLNNAYNITKSSIDTIGYDITGISAISETTTVSDKSIFSKKHMYAIRQTQLQKETIPVTESREVNLAFTNSVSNITVCSLIFGSTQSRYDSFMEKFYDYNWTEVDLDYYINTLNASINLLILLDESIGSYIPEVMIQEYNVASSRIMQDLRVYSNLILSNSLICYSNILAAQAAGGTTIGDLLNASALLRTAALALEPQCLLTLDITKISSNLAKNATVSEVNIQLNFTNPVKELFIFIKNDPSLSFNDYRHAYYDFKNRYRTYYENNYDYTQYQHLESACLRFNNEIAFDHDYMYLQSYEPYKNYPTASYVRGFINFRNVTSNVQYPDITDYPFYYMYSFSMYPQNSYPSGQVNFSRIRYKNLALRLYPSSHIRFARIYARSYNVLVVNDGIAGLMFTNNSDYDYKFDMNNISDGSNGIFTTLAVEPGPPPPPIDPGPIVM